MSSTDREQMPIDGSIDAGLLLLSLVTPRGKERTLREIAEACGVRHQTIYHIEQQAIKKLRKAFTEMGLENGV